MRAVFVFTIVTSFGWCQTDSPNKPTWWAKYQHLAKNGEASSGGATQSPVVGANADVSDECGPQSETFITLNAAQPKMLAAVLE